MNQEKISPNDFLTMAYDEKIAVMTDAPARLDLPEEASYLAQYLFYYRPILPPAPHMDNESSVDIAETLQSVCQIDTKVISRVMRMLGYRLHFQGVSQPTWSMKHVDSK